MVGEEEMGIGRGVEEDGGWGNFLVFIGRV